MVQQDDRRGSIRVIVLDANRRQDGLLGHADDSQTKIDNGDSLLTEKLLDHGTLDDSVKKWRSGDGRAGLR
jgi:hypothetical protein